MTLRNKISYLPQIQALRGFAALCVVFTHAFLGAGWMRLDAGNTSHPQLGEFGVDVFFVISGFIMVVVSQTEFGKKGASWDFLKKRLKRVVPLYWLLTMALIAVVLFAPQFIAYPDVDYGYWAKSLLFIPAEHPIEGGIRPLLVVGWTSQYEMFFYALFVIPQNAMLAFYSEPVILEFAAGMGLAVLYIRGVKINGALIWALTAIVMIFLLFGWLILSDVEIDRVFYFGVPAALLMACFTLPKGASKVPIGLVWSRLGDSSYALYLSHVFVIAAMGVLFRYFAASDWQQYTGLCVVFVIVSVISSCIAGWGLHILVERPFGRMLASKRNHFNLTEPKQSAISR